MHINTQHAALRIEGCFNYFKNRDYIIHSFCCQYLYAPNLDSTCSSFPTVFSASPLLFHNRYHLIHKIHKTLNQDEFRHYRMSNDQRICLPMLGPIFFTMALKSALSALLVAGNLTSLRRADGNILITYGLKSFTSTMPDSAAIILQ